MSSVEFYLPTLFIYAQFLLDVNMNSIASLITSIFPTKLTITARKPDCIHFLRNTVSIPIEVPKNNWLEILGRPSAPFWCKEFIR